MKAIIKYQIYEITENQGWSNGKSVPQKVAKMSVVPTSDPNDPNYVYGQISGGSNQTLSTINPNVYNAWFVGAIVTCEMEVQEKPVVKADGGSNPPGPGQPGQP